jgi:hypothetical protein
MSSSKESSVKESVDYISKAKSFAAEMTLEEKTKMLSGDGWWRTHAFERVGIPRFTEEKTFGDFNKVALTAKAAHWQS